jgi:hypothetical protein
MKRIFTLLVFCGIASEVISQSLSPQVISSSGAFLSVVGYSLSQTVGEMSMVETFKGSSAILTQGFQQPESNGNVGILDFTAAGGVLEIFPNPAVDYFRLNFEFAQSGEISILIYNTLGQNISSEYSDNYYAGSKSLLVTTSNLPSGFYYVKSVFMANDGTQYINTKKIEIIR